VAVPHTLPCLAISHSVSSSDLGPQLKLADHPLAHVKLLDLARDASDRMTVIAASQESAHKRSVTEVFADTGHATLHLSTMSVLVLGLPVVLTLAWYHGHRGLTRIGPGELTITALLVLRLPSTEPLVPLDSSVIASTSTQTAAPAASPQGTSLAVLPFADMSPQHDQEYFSDGLSEELLNQLAQISDLKVAGRTSSFSFKGKSEDLRLIGRTLGVISDQVASGTTFSAQWARMISSARRPGKLHRASACPAHGPCPDLAAGSGKRIDELNAEGLEITYVTRHHPQPANQCGRGDERVFKMVIRPPVQELRPPSKNRSVRRQNAETLRDIIQPSLDFAGFRRILAPSDLNPRLDFPDCHSRDIQGVLRCGCNPSHHARVGLVLAQFGHDIRIE